MHDQPSPARRPGATPSDGRCAFIERRVLLELVTDPPADGDEPAQLATCLSERVEDVDLAVTALEQAGLARRERGTVHATIAARRFDALWPIRP